MNEILKFKNSIINFSDEGSGNPLILLHGYLESLRIWDDFSPLISDQYRVIRIDLLGHGESEFFNDIASMELMAESVKFVMDHLKIRKAFLIGHSLGGYVTLAFLDLFPDRLTGFCLFHSQPFADTPQTIEKRKREIMLVQKGKKDVIYNLNIPNAFANDNLDILKKEIEYAKSVARDTSDSGIIAALNGLMARPDRSEVLEDTKLPFLWILGMKDNYIPHDAVLQKVKLPVNNRVVSLLNSGHQGFMEEMENSAKELKDFLSGI